MTSPEELNRTILLCRDYVADGLSDDEICHSFQSLRVLCVSDLENLSSHSGQTALVTTVSLLSRMGMQVELRIPEVPMLLPQPPLSGPSICKALLESSGALVAGATVREETGLNPDLIFVLGNTKGVDSLGPLWRLCGSDWYGKLAMEGMMDASLWTADWPIGSMVSAALAAGEAFKFVMRRLSFREQADRVYFEQSPVCTWGFGSVAVPSKGVSLGEVDVISAGAICQSALYALTRLPNVEMWGRIFDADLTSASNLNRNMLTLTKDVGSLKVQVVADRCAPKLNLEPVTKRFEGKTLGRRLAPRVLVGVDDIPSRWEVQRQATGWVAVSGTSHFNVSSSGHTPGEPCSGCLHFVDDAAGADPIPTVSFVSFWAGLSMVVRLVREALGCPYPRNQQHLWLTPLRMDQPRAAMWLPVARHRNCPVPCVNLPMPSAIGV
jgi:hypothetical protein